LSCRTLDRGTNLKIVIRGACHTNHLMLCDDWPYPGVCGCTRPSDVTKRRVSQSFPGAACSLRSPSIFTCTLAILTPWRVTCEPRSIHRQAHTEIVCKSSKENCNHVGNRDYKGKKTQHHLPTCFEISLLRLECGLSSDRFSTNKNNGRVVCYRLAHIFSTRRKHSVGFKFHSINLSQFHVEYLSCLKNSLMFWP
jgi:hypothetical protein